MSSFSISHYTSAQSSRRAKMMIILEEYTMEEEHVVCMLFVQVATLFRLQFEVIA